MTAQRAAVSVIVLNYNRATTTLLSEAALWRAATPLLGEVLVVDNGSRADEIATLRSGLDSRTRLVEIGTNRYFGEGNNIGAEMAAGDLIVFLNNDAFVEEGWLRHMVAAMASDDDVAAVGAMLLYPDGRVQEVGGIVLPTGDVVQVGKGAVWESNHYTEICTVDYCSASCLLMRKADFERVGGFSFEYEPAYYEDTDLCLKLWRTVGKVVVQPLARVVHLESHTTSDRSLELEGIVELNREKFLHNWGAWLRSRSVRMTALDPVGGRATNGAVPVTSWPPAPSPSQHAPAIAAVYTPYEMTPGGGERVVFELLRHLSGMLGRERVALATPHPYSALRMDQIGRNFGFEELVATPRVFDEVLEEPVDLGIVVGNAIVPSVPGFGRRRIYLCQFPFVTPAAYVEERRSWLEDFQEVWVYSEFAARYVRGMAQFYSIDCPPVRVIYPPATWPSAEQGLPWSERRTLLTVGRFFTEGHNKRQDVVIDVFRRLVDSGWTMDLALAGSLHTTADSRERYSSLVKQAEGLPCRFYPNASHQEIERLYATSSVLVHAAGFGVDPLEFPERLEHFGIVPIEAASMGCIPVVYGEGGPAEVVTMLGAGTTFATPDECVEKIASLLSDPDAAAAHSDHIRERAQLFSIPAFQARVTEALEELGAAAAW